MDNEWPSVFDGDANTRAWINLLTRLTATIKQQRREMFEGGYRMDSKTVWRYSIVLEYMECALRAMQK